PRGFALIRELRRTLIESEAGVLAPCPHAGSCPIVGNDWCHFSARVQRSALHRQVKEADLSHEDEKFSYIAFMRTPTRRAAARVLRHPQRPPRRVQLVACTDSGLRKITLGKSHPAYKIAKDIKWGSALPEEALQ
ncbi:MAG TPA: small ribosomal subunit Rsm22 family protein, partial [Chloroflexota bacterium]|nr:small ribosomal subunit Rsm22 family protein [Chloroflexota bacterium]